MIVYKYELNIGITYLELPPYSKILSVGAQGETPVIWAQVGDRNLRPYGKFEILTVLTGKTFDASGYTYVGTLQTEQGFVGHVYTCRVGRVVG